MKKLIFIGLCLCLVATGCIVTTHRYVTIDTQQIIIHKPARPKLRVFTAAEIGNDPVKKALLDDLLKMKTYAQRLEVGIDEYNVWADIKNKHARKFLKVD